MGLIIKDKIRQFIKGYPTMSDKYNVLGGILAGSSAVNFGELVVYSSTSGYFEKPAATGTTAADIAGIVVATNVKLAENWPGTTVQVNPGEAFNLLVNGYVAVELDSTAVIADVVPGANMYISAAGKIVTSTTSSAIKMDRYFFTGLYENIGTALAPKYIAEVYVI